MHEVFTEQMQARFTPFKSPYFCDGRFLDKIESTLYLTFGDLELAKSIKKLAFSEEEEKEYVG